MTRDYGGCFGGRCFHRDDEEDDDDNIDGYYRLSSSGGRPETVPMSRDGGADDDQDPHNDYFRPVDAYQGSHRNKEYDEVDMKGKRLSKKLRRRELKKRIRYYLHSTWKWMRRGMAALTPGMTSIFMLSPTQNAFVSADSRLEAISGKYAPRVQI
ncbi:uncharacterized protein LOC101846963 [Aplysia californica]|uniref:Uncharacterized protein LOC101846963 n=1 Tax=Aplysia californica TaxID=6500 RepID=A0ABM0JQB6_APLCA|nr:uncharacterized protein LOC101846963 [Aplysia californica]